MAYRWAARALLQRVASAVVSFDGQTVGDVLGNSHELMTIYDQHASDASRREAGVTAVPGQRSGAGDGIRTHDLLLGRQPL